MAEATNHGSARNAADSVAVATTNLCHLSRFVEPGSRYFFANRWVCSFLPFVPTGARCSIFVLMDFPDGSGWG